MYKNIVKFTRTTLLVSAFIPLTVGMTAIGAAHAAATTAKDCFVAVKDVLTEEN